MKTIFPDIFLRGRVGWKECLEMDRFTPTSREKHEPVGCGLGGQHCSAFGLCLRGGRPGTQAERRAGSQMQLEREQEGRCWILQVTCLERRSSILQ